MSRFFSKKFSSLTPYTPGEQPQDKSYIKLNTNESPFPPPKAVIDAIGKEAEKLMLYSDPECKELISTLADYYGLKPEQLIVGNGSDEILNFIFSAFCDDKHPAVFPEISYGFYKVFAQQNGVPYREIPLKDDFTIDVSDYFVNDSVIVIANPNAPTGIFLSLDKIEQILINCEKSLVVIDEAYVDFGAQSAMGLISKYDNLIVVQTYSKSRSMAGARLGFGAASTDIISDLHTLRYSTNPYNVNRMTLAAGKAAIEEQKYFDDNCKIIIENREYTTKKLQNLGFDVLDSKTNFIFAKSSKISGKELYLKLKEHGILVRHFDKEPIKEYNRITIGTIEQMDALISEIEKIIEELK